MLESYSTGRGSFRLRARWQREDKGRGVYQIIVTEIPYGVQKSKLIEKIAELLLAKKLPLLKDVRDESADDIRLVLEPRAGTVDDAVLMEQLFKVTDLEQRIPLNMNVLDRGIDAARDEPARRRSSAWLEHRKDVLVRRTSTGSNRSPAGSKILDGYIVAYLNLDEVIRIIREEDEPKRALMETFKPDRRSGRSHPQHAPAVAAQARGNRAAHRAQEPQRGADAPQRAARLRTRSSGARSPSRSTTSKKTYGKGRVPAARHGAARPSSPTRRMSTTPKKPTPPSIEREPITVILSEKGWVRADEGPHRRGRRREGLQGRRPAEARSSTPKPPTSCCCSRPRGKVYTIGADRLPGGRGQGEPLRLMVDMEEGQDLVDLFVYTPGPKRLIASSAGDGFVVERGRAARQYPQGQAGAQRRGHRGSQAHRAGRQATRSRSSARTAR